MCTSFGGLVLLLARLYVIHLHECVKYVCNCDITLHSRSHDDEVNTTS